MYFIREDEFLELKSILGDNEAIDWIESNCTVLKWMGVISSPGHYIYMDEHRYIKSVEVWMDEGDLIASVSGMGTAISVSKMKGIWYGPIPIVR